MSANTIAVALSSGLVGALVTQLVQLVRDRSTARREEARRKEDRDERESAERREYQREAYKQILGHTSTIWQNTRYLYAFVAEDYAMERWADRVGPIRDAISASSDLALVYATDALKNKIEALRASFSLYIEKQYAAERAWLPRLQEPNSYELYWIEYRDELHENYDPVRQELVGVRELVRYELGLARPTVGAD